MKNSRINVDVLSTYECSNLYKKKIWKILKVKKYVEILKNVEIHFKILKNYMKKIWEKVSPVIQTETSIDEMKNTMPWWSM